MYTEEPIAESVKQIYVRLFYVSHTIKNCNTYTIYKNTDSFTKCVQRMFIFSFADELLNKPTNKFQLQAVNRHSGFIIQKT